MRDNHKNMIELLGASKENNVFSCLIRHQIQGKLLQLRFGIPTKDYSRLKKILQFRPYQDTGVAAYRYFFVWSYRDNPEDESLAFIAVHVEQLDRHKQYEFLLSKKVIANLLWFYKVTNPKEVAHLIET